MGSVEHTVEVCPAWVEHNPSRTPSGGINDGDLSRPALVQTMVRGGAEAWETVTSFCKPVILVKERSDSGRGDPLPHAPAAARGDALEVGDRETISGHRKRGLADGKQWVAHRPTRTEPGSTVRCVPRVSQRDVSTTTVC